MSGLSNDYLSLKYNISKILCIAGSNCGIEILTLRVSALNKLDTLKIGFTEACSRFHGLIDYTSNAKVLKMANLSVCIRSSADTNNEDQKKCVRKCHSLSAYNGRKG